MQLYMVYTATVLWVLTAPVYADVAGVTPMAKVEGLLGTLLQHIQEDGDKEQVSYDEYACWCEDTLSRKANAINDEKDTISAAGNRIKELKGELGAYGQELSNIRGDIKANAEAQATGQEMREKEKRDNLGRIGELEQYINSLEMAIRALEGAGELRTGFLGTLQEAKVLSVAAGIKKVLLHSEQAGTTSPERLKMVQQFVDRPEDFLGGRAGAMSAAQIENNPFGDYAPQSNVISGIMKQMYKEMVLELERVNMAEAEATKAYLDLTSTKRREMDGLQGTLDRESLAEADASKDLADTNLVKDDEEGQLKADEGFFDAVKIGCREKALQWSERSRLRTEEMKGVQEAINVLSDGHHNFLNATKSFFLQVESRLQATTRNRLTKAAAMLQKLAAKYHSRNLEKLSMEAMTVGQFNEVIADINKMIALLRQEQEADIAHKDRCEAANKKNSDSMSDLDEEISESGMSIDHMKNNKGSMLDELAKLETDINQTQEEMAEAQRIRDKEHVEFKQVLRDDLEAEAHLREAKDWLHRFYRRNNITVGSLVLLQKTQKQEPEGKTEYKERKDLSEAPETIFKNARYGGRKEESRGIIYILDMLAEDMHREALRAQEEEDAAVAEFRKNQIKAQHALDAQLASKMAIEGRLASLEAKIFDKSEGKRQMEGALKSEKDMKESLYSDCSWVKTHFDSRRDARTAEINGLTEAKTYLAGIESGSELAP